MADHRVPSQQANPIPANIYPRPAPSLHRLRGQNRHVAGDDQQGVHREGVPQPAVNVAMQGEMQYPGHIDAANYNVGHYHPPPPPYPEIPHVHMPWDVGAAEGDPAQAPPFAPVVQENHDGLYGYGAHLPAADPPDAFPAGVWPHPVPPIDMPQANGLRNLASRFLNNPDTLVNMIRIEHGPGGRFEVWIALELVNIF